MPDKKLQLQQVTEIGVNENSEMYISDFISNNLLDEWLDDELRRSIIGSEQWYRDPNWWLRVRSSPLYKAPEIEKHLIEKNAFTLSRYLSGTCKIFFGIGTGANELPIVKLDDEKKYKKCCEVIAIDVCEQFLKDFAISLFHEYYKHCIKYLGIRNIFENLDLTSLSINGKSYSKNALICLGNTIANFDPKAIFEIFSRNAKVNDLLLIGFYKQTNLEDASKIYGSIPGFKELLLSIISKILGFSGLVEPDQKTEWSLNPKGNWIEAKMNNLVLFRSKVYTAEELFYFAKGVGFSIIDIWEEEKAGLILYKKD